MNKFMAQAGMIQNPQQGGQGNAPGKWPSWFCYEIDCHYVDLAPAPVAGILLREKEQWFARCRGIGEDAMLAAMPALLQLLADAGENLQFFQDAKSITVLEMVLKTVPLEHPAAAIQVVRDPQGAIYGVFFMVAQREVFVDEMLDNATSLSKLVALSLLRAYEQATLLHRVREHEHMESKLRDTHQQYLLLIDHLKETIFQTDIDGRSIFLNKAWSDMTGFSVAETLGTPYTRYIHPADREMNQRYFQQLISGEQQTCRHEVRCLTKTGGCRWVEVFAQQTRDSKGVIIGTSGALRDVTDRHVAEEKLRQQESVLRAFFNCPGFRMGIFELEGNELYYLDVNPAEAAALNVKAEEIAGKSASSIGINHDLLAVWVVNVKEAQSRKQPVRFEYASDEGTPNERWYGMTVCPMTETLPTLPRFSYVMEDITDRRRVQIELQAARLAAEHASKVKSEFLANMSHEIRTPMTAIVGFADMLLEEGQTPQDRADCISTIRRNGAHLLRIINDILDISKIEAGMMQVESMQMPLLEVLAEVESLMRPRATKKQLDFRVELATAVPELVRSDPTRLRQILVNLVGNAIKFTDKGSVRIIVEVPSDVIPPEAHFRVVDTGPGIPHDRIPMLFEPFTQADASVSRTHGGTGLGLTISRRLAEMLGGNIRVKSIPGQGSEFTVSIKIGCVDGVRLVHTPLVPSVRHASDNNDHLPPNKKIQAHVLLAEDSLDNQRLIRHHLVRVGATVELAETGIQARDKAIDAYRQGNAFDVILMDMQMPDMDGYMATRQLRSRGYRGPIIALTASAMQGDRERCIEAGCDDFASKPIDLHNLIDLVETYAARRDAFVG